MAAKQQAPAGAKEVPESGVPTGSDPIHLQDPESTAAERHRRRVALAAFYRAEARGFAPGRELEDWLQAERELAEIDALGERPAAASPSRTPEPAAESAAAQRHEGAAARRPAAPKRSKTTRGTSIQARNRGDAS